MVEPVCSDVLWRLIKIHRGGRRGFQQKCRLISEGLNGGQLRDQHPYILDESYVTSWGGEVVHSVHNIHSVYEIASESELEEEVEEAERPPSSSRALADTNPRAAAKPKVAPRVPQALRPRVLLPDLVRLYERQNASATSASEQGIFVEVENTRGFSGVFNYFSTDRNILGAPFCLVLDWHQVLDRSKEESARTINRIPTANLQFLRRVRERFGDGVLVCICSHIEQSSANLERLLRAVNNTPEVLRESLICFITVTVNRCGPLGKLQTIKAITQGYLVPSAIIDDNEQIIDECRRCDQVGTIHIKLRKKKPAEDPNFVCQFLEDSFPSLEVCVRERLAAHRRQREQ